MSKWVTIRRKEFRRLRDAAQAFPDAETVQNILIMQDAEAFRKLKALTGRPDLAQIVADAEKWRTVAREYSITDPCHLRSSAELAKDVADAEEWRRLKKRLARHDIMDVAHVVRLLDEAEADAKKWHEFKSVSMQQQADGLLGALVRQMPTCSHLIRHDRGIWSHNRSPSEYASPEEALINLKKYEVPNL